MPLHCRPAVRVLLAALLLAACDGSALLGPDAAQGVEGLVLRGPTCPVASETEACGSVPYPARIDVRGSDGHRIGRFQADAQGRFRVGLEPGSYRLDPLPGDPFPTASDVEIVVARGVWLEVTVLYDTGIR